MRPLHLKLEGLRSYRKLQEIDFKGVTLMAIVGDTGAGKSSILEAICFALYGMATFDKRATKQLVADGAEQLRVELTFQAENRRFRVTRATSRTGYPAPVHLLVGLDDDTRIDNEGAVTRRVTELVGLDFDAFQRAVVLPQGRFQALLQATERERASILKGILRLEVLDHVRDTAKEIEDKNRPLFTALQLERAGLLRDPDAEIQMATAARQAAEADRQRLQAVRKALDELTEEAKRLDTAAGRFEGMREKLVQALATKPHDGLHALLQRARDLERERQELDATRKAAVEKEKQLARELVEVGGGAPIAETAGSVSTLESSLEMLDALDRATAVLHKDRKEQEQRRKQLRLQQRALPSLEQEADQARNAFAQATKELNDLAAAATRVLSLLEQQGKNSEGLKTLQERMRKVEDQIESKTARRSTLDLAALVEEERRAQENLERVHRANAAAHAASGCAPGDPCPVCRRKLAAGFEPPPIEGEEEARQAFNRARDARGRTQTDLTTLEAEIAASTRELEQTRKDAAALSVDLEKGQEELRKHAPDGVEALHAALEVANTEKDRTEEIARALEGKLGGERQVVQSEEKDLAKREQELQTRQQNLERDATLLVERCRKLGVDLTVTDATAAVTTDARPGAASGAAGADLDAATGDARRRVLVQAIQARRERRDRMLALEQERATASATVQTTGEALAKLTEQVRLETEGPHRKHAGNLSVLRERVREAMELREENAVAIHGEPEGRDEARNESSSLTADPASSDLVRDCDAAAQLEREAAALAARLLATGQTKRSDAESVRARRPEALAEHGVESLEKLDEAITDAAARAKTAERQRARAESERPHARRLDHILQTTEPLLDGLKELTQLLADGKFIAFVVEQRQRSLLAIASEILLQVTGGRFGFSETFKILDRVSGQPRDVKTLSGGETFLASLALALALVELAGRSGGRLEALFLDEGFGTLDANCLSEALDALGRQAENGRLVAVISHLQAVTEGIDRVLHVTRGPDGSTANWLGQPDREAFAMGELQAGLLA